MVLTLSQDCKIFFEQASIINMSLWYKTIQERVGTCLIFWWFIKLMSRKHSSFYHAFVSLTISNQISRPAISIIWEHKCILQELCLKICFTKHPSIQNIIANDKLFGQISISLQSMWPWRNVLRESKGRGIIWSKHIRSGSHSSCLMLLSLVLIQDRASDQGKSCRDNQAPQLDTNNLH